MSAIDKVIAASEVREFGGKIIYHDYAEKFNVSRSVLSQRHVARLYGRQCFGASDPSHTKFPIGPDAVAGDTCCKYFQERCE
jgi:hypothetical protein